VQADVDSNDTLLLKDVWRAWTPELAGFFGTCADRRRRLRAAGLSGAGRRAGLLLRCCFAEWRARGPGSSLVV
jgi:hypothetical protein